MISDSYLEIAEAVLKLVRRPMSTREMVKLAYLHRIMPPHLHGKTQHKTLGARLSEDILTYRTRSRFFRNRPGKFFLRELIKDKTIPSEFRSTVVARRRKRELKRNNVLCIDPNKLKNYAIQSGVIISPDEWSALIKTNAISYEKYDNAREKGLYPAMSYPIIMRNEEILIHSKGAYAESRQNYVGKLMIGFPIPICHDDLTLLDQDDHGAISAGLTAVAMDLDLEFSPEFPAFEQSADLIGIVAAPSDETGIVLFAVVSVTAVERFQPSGRRLAVGSLHWRSLGQSDISSGDFDPASMFLMEKLGTDILIY